MLWLIQRQLKSKDAGTRRKAAEQLCLAPQPRLLRTLRAVLADEDAEVRRLAAVALGKLEDERGLDPLLGALRDRDPEVLKAVILALKKYSDERTTAGLVPLLHHADAGVRGHAAKILEFLGWRPTRPEDEIWFLVARGQFSRATMFGVAALPALEAALISSSSGPGVAIVEALGQIGDARVLRPLVHALKSGDPGICIAAVTVLTRWGDPQVIEPLVGLLRQRNGQIRLAAVEALGRLRAATALESIRGLLSDPIWEVRREAAEALGRLKDRRAVEALAHSLKDADADVREATAMALGNLTDRRAIGPLVLALKDGSSGVRRIAAAALSRIDPEWSASPEARAAVEELKGALHDPDANVRHFVGQLLVSLGAIEPEAAPAAEELDSSSPAKRRKLAVSLFIAVLCDRDRDLRLAAAQALGQLGDDRAQSALRRVQTDTDWAVRDAAERALQALSTGGAHA